MQRPQHSPHPFCTHQNHTRAVLHVTALALAAWAMVGCDPPVQGVGWDVTFRCEADAERVAALDIEVRSGNCQGLPIDGRHFSAAGTGEPFPQLEPGSYGFWARATTATGEPLASGCEDYRLPRDTIELELSSENCQEDGSLSTGATGGSLAADTGSQGTEDAATLPDAAPGEAQDSGAQGSSDAGSVGTAPLDAQVGAEADGGDGPEAPPATCPEGGCDDQNPCTVDSCSDGICVYDPLSLTLECDNVPCTVNDQCVTGACVPGGADNSVCEDEKPCTSDTCIPSVGCTHDILNDTECDDGLDCTEDDRCSGGSCTGTPVCEEGEECAYAPNSCSPCENDAQCDDGDPCTLDTCACDGEDCAKTFCQYASAPDGTDCDDDAECSEGDTCRGGECLGDIAPGACDDANPCTDERCVPGVGCAFSLHAGSCDDGLGCTSGDTCVGSLCTGTDTCNDGNPCTMETCEVGGCKETLLDVACDDGLSCTEKDSCTGGQCVGKDTCGGGGACSNETCVEDGEVDTCEQTVLTGSCDDGRACTAGDRCEGGVCVSGASTCGANASCGVSECSCDGGFSPCDGQCVDLDSDNAHCGQCGWACPPGVGCVQGSCVPANCSSLSHGGQQYLGCSEGLSWSAARTRCRGWGADLASISSAAEHDALAGWLPAGNHWLGGSDQRSEGVWRWVTPGGSRDGTHFFEECDGYLGLSCDGTPDGQDKYPDVYDNWAADEPGASLGQDCLLLQVSGSASAVWTDFECAAERPFVCEGT